MRRLDPNAGAYRQIYAKEYEVARRILRDYPGVLEWAQDDFVAFRYRDERACIAFYPHKHLSGMSHLRVRSQASADIGYAHDLMLRLDVGAGHNPMFTQRADQRAYDTRDRFIIKSKIKPGWAAQGIL